MLRRAPDRPGWIGPHAQACGPLRFWRDPLTTTPMVNKNCHINLSVFVDSRDRSAYPLIVEVAALLERGASKCSETRLCRELAVADGLWLFFNLPEGRDKEHLCLCEVSHSRKVVPLPKGENPHGQRLGRSGSRVANRSDYRGIGRTPQACHRRCAGVLCDCVGRPLPSGGVHTVAGWRMRRQR